MGLFFRNTESSEKAETLRKDQSLDDFQNQFIDNSKPEQLILWTRDALDDYSDDALLLKSQGKDVSDLKREELRALARRILYVANDVKTSH